METFVEREQKPRLNAFVVCEQVIEDTFSQQRSLIGIVHHLKMPSIPGAIRRLFVVAYFSGESGEHPLSLLVNAPDAQLIFRIEQRVSLSEIASAADMIVELRDLPVLVAGTYTFLLHLYDEPFAQWSVDIQMSGSDTGIG